MFKPPSVRCRTGFTIAEVIVAAACLGVFFLGMFAISGQVVRQLRASGQQAAATFCLQQRMEELRRLTWGHLVDGAYVRDNVFNASSITSSNLPGLAEQITINVYPTATTPTTITRSNAGVATLVTSNSALTNASMIRVDAQITWNNSTNGTNTRQYTTVVTKGGILR